MRRPGSVALHGRVRDTLGGVVVGAAVSVAFGAEPPVPSAMTDEHGEFVAWSLPGSVRVIVHATGYALGSAHGEAPDHFFDVSLLPASAIAGRVVERLGAAPVAHARVEAVDDFGARQSTESADDGTFRIDGLGPGTYDLEGIAPGLRGHASGAILIGIAESATDVVVELERALPVTGRVLEATTHEPCPGGEVVLHELHLEEEAKAPIEPSGAVRFLAVLPGTYEVEVRCEGHTRPSDYPPLIVATRPIEGVTWEVDRGSVARGIVVGEGGELVPNARVIANPTEWGARVEAITDARGEFVLRGLRNRTYDVTAHASASAAGADATEKLDVSGGHDLSGLRLTLGRPATIAGNVVDSDGRPVKSATVYLSGPTNRRVETHDDGSFVFHGLLPGGYQLHARAELLRDGLREGYTQGKPDVTLAVGETVKRNVVIAGHAAFAEGRVVDRDGGPLPGFFVEAKPGNEPTGFARWGGVRDRVVTDENGHFRITWIGNGELSLRAYRTAWLGGDPHARQAGGDRRRHPRRIGDAHRRRDGRSRSADAHAIHRLRRRRRPRHLAHRDGTQRERNVHAARASAGKLRRHDPGAGRDRDGERDDHRRRDGVDRARARGSRRDARGRRLGRRRGTRAGCTHLARDPRPDLAPHQRRIHDDARRPLRISSCCRIDHGVLRFATRRRARLHVRARCRTRERHDHRFSQEARRWGGHGRTWGRHVRGLTVARTRQLRYCWRMRRRAWRVGMPVATVASIAIAIVIAACGSFGADAAPTSDDGGDALADTGATGEASGLDTGSGDATCAADLMTDPRNCGRCGRDCLSGTCVAGACQSFVLASSLVMPSVIAIGPSHVYWAEGTNNSHEILSCPRSGCGGAGPLLILGSLPDVRSLAVANDTLFFMTYDNNAVSSQFEKCAVMSCGTSRVTIDGPITSVLFPFTPLRAESDGIWWGKQVVTAGEIRHLAFGGGATPEVVVTAGCIPARVARGGSDVAWTCTNGSTIEHCAVPCTVDGGSDLFLASAVTNQLERSTGYAVWDEQGTGNLEVFTDVSGVHMLSARGQGPMVLAGSNDLVFQNGLVGSIEVCRLPGCGTRTTLAVNASAVATSLAADRDAVYWVSQQQSAVLGVAR